MHRYGALAVPASLTPALHCLGELRCQGSNTPIAVARRGNVRRLRQLERLSHLLSDSCLIGLLLLSGGTATEAGLAVKKVRNQLN